MKRMIRAASIAASVVLVLALVGCSDDDSSLVGPSPVAFSASSSPTAPVPTTASSPLSIRVEWVATTPPSVVAGNNQQVYRFTAVVHGGVAPYTFKWNFQDGTPQVEDNPVTHQFHRPGTYNVVVTVTDATGTRARNDSGGDLAIEITATPFSISCHVDPTEGDAPLAVHFRAEPEGNVGPITWTWEFGDGEGADGRMTAHTYNPAPRRPAPRSFVWLPSTQTFTFQPTATATDDLGRVARCSEEVVVTVVAAVPPIALAKR